MSLPAVGSVPCWYPIVQCPDSPFVGKLSELEPEDGSSPLALINIPQSIRGQSQSIHGIPFPPERGHREEARLDSHAVRTYDVRDVVP